MQGHTRVFYSMQRAFAICIVLSLSIVIFVAPLIAITVLLLNGNYQHIHLLSFAVWLLILLMLFAMPEQLKYKIVITPEFIEGRKTREWYTKLPGEEKKLKLTGHNYSLGFKYYKKEFERIYFNSVWNVTILNHWFGRDLRTVLLFKMHDEAEKKLDVSFSVCRVSKTNKGDFDSILELLHRYTSVIDKRVM